MNIDVLSSDEMLVFAVGQPPSPQPYQACMNQSFANLPLKGITREEEEFLHAHLGILDDCHMQSNSGPLNSILCSGIIQASLDLASERQTKRSPRIKTIGIQWALNKDDSCWFN